MSDQHYRHELKHFINYGDYLSLKSRLKQVAKQDDHVDENGIYMVHNFYFDDINDKALFEKIMGVNEREKYRLRYYNNNTNMIRLEKKSKRNGLGQKQMALLTRAEAEKIIEGDYDWIKDNNNPILYDFYNQVKNKFLKAKTISTYKREPYIFRAGNVRVTIDSEMKTGLSSNDFFNTKVPMVPSVHPNTMLLEVKFDEFLPDVIRDILQTNYRQATAYSKYAMSRNYL